MSAPLNSIDYIRFKKLAALIMRGNKGDVRLYVTESFERPGKAYVHIEMTSHEISYVDAQECYSVPIEEIMKEV